MLTASCSRSAIVRYTVWRHGRLLGETDLDFTRWRLPRYRAGRFVLRDPAAAIEHGRERDLELRRADGTVVPTEWIDIRDNTGTEDLVQLMLLDHSAIP